MVMEETRWGALSRGTTRITTKLGRLPADANRISSSRPAQLLCSDPDSAEPSPDSHNFSCCTSDGYGSCWYPKTASHNPPPRLSSRHVAILSSADPPPTARRPPAPSPPLPPYPPSPPHTHAPHPPSPPCPPSPP